MSKTIRIDYCGMDGAGATVTQARQDASRKLSSLVRDLRDHAPIVVACGGYAKLIYRGAESWCGKLIMREGELNRDPHGYEETGYAAREDAIRSAANHVAQLAWSHDVESDS